MQATDQASKECFDCDKFIQALKDDDTEQIKQQRSLMPWIHSNDMITFETALGNAILNSDLKLAEKMATQVITTRKTEMAIYNRDLKKYHGAEDLPFWGQFILYGMTDRYYNRWENTAFFKGLVKLVKDRVFDPWQCINSAETFIKMIRLGLGTDPTLKFTEKGESLTYYVIMTNKIGVQNKMHILRLMDYRKLLDLNPYNGFPSPAIATIMRRYSSIWNDVLCRLSKISEVHDEHGNNMLYYMFKHKVNAKHLVRHQQISTIVKMLCEKNKEGKSMVEYGIVNNTYPDWFFHRGYNEFHTLAYLVHQELVRNNELEVLQRLPPIPDRWLDLYSYLLTMYDFPHNKPRDQYVQSYTGTRRKNIGKDKFIDGSSTTFTFEQLPIEIFEIILRRLDPVEVMCLKMTSKVVDMAFNRTRYLSECFPRSLSTTPLVDSPAAEFNRQVKLDVNWKKGKYRMHEITGTPYRPAGCVMDEHWLLTEGWRAQWLCNLHTSQKIETPSDGTAALSILLESGPANIPLVAALVNNKFVVMKCTLGGHITSYKAAHLDTSFTYADNAKVEHPYVRQLMGKQIVLGRDGAIWNYEVDATIAHLLDPISTADVAMCDVHANESLIVAATTAGLSLYDHRTFTRITNITDNLIEQQSPPLRVYIHNNEVVQVTNSDIYYYDVRTHRLLDTVHFIGMANANGGPRPVPNYVFDTSGTRCVLNYPQDSFNIIYNIRERGWESGLMTGKNNEVYALNSYSIFTSYGGFVLFS